MKKLIILFFIMGITIIGYAQTGCPNCVTDGSFATTDGMPGINLTSMPPACIGQNYSQDVTLYLPGTFTYQGLPINLRNIVITSVTGMPAGLSWEKNGGGTTWTVNGNTTRGCFRICGTPTATGTFSATLNITANVTVYGMPQAQPQTYNIPLTVIDVPAQAGPITGTSVVNLGQTGVGYSVTPDASATSYIWNYTGAGATINGTGSSITIDYSGSATGGTLTVFAQNNCGNGQVSANYSVSLSSTSAPSAAGSISGTDSVCIGLTGVLYSVPEIANATEYIWEYSGSGVTINGNSDSVYLDFSLNTIPGNLTVKGRNGIGDGAVSPLYSIFIRPLPDPAGIISGPTEVCSRHNADYMVPSINNTSAYLWSYSGLGASITGSGNTIIVYFDSSATSGDLKIFGQNSCGSGDTSTLAISIIPALSAPLAINGLDTICAGDTGIVFSIAPVINAESYLWTYDGTGASITGSDTVIIMNFLSNATSGNLLVVAVDSCGNSSSSTLHNLTIDDCNAGISEKDAGFEINIMPNPGNGVFDILINSNEIVNGSYSVINSIGQILKSEGIDLQKGMNKMKTDLGNVPDGIYYIRINTEIGYVNKMIIINK